MYVSSFIAGNASTEDARYEEFTESGLVEPPHVRIGHPIINMDYDKHYVISISLFLGYPTLFRAFRQTTHAWV